MTELFPNISQKTRDEVAIVWKMARTMKPEEAANCLLSYKTNAPTEEERDFIDFYFNLQMELNKNG